MPRGANVKRLSRIRATLAAAIVVAGTLGIATVATAADEGARAPTRASLSGQAITPVFIAGTYRGRRPITIGLSGDAGNIVLELHWQHWGTVSALGAGTSNLQGCVPNCAAGSETPVRTTIEFLDPRHGYFTKLVELRNGQRSSFYYTPGHTPDNWPGYAR
jgi:hypothetical protein